MKLRWPAILSLFLAVAGAASARAAITADDLVLLVNKQQPEGRRLAEAYAKARGVPDGRIIELDIPDNTDIAREFYESSIANVVRQELQSRQLAGKAKCLVLFYGLPLRIRDRDSTPQERTEVDTVLNPAIATLQNQMKETVVKLEAIASSLDPSFRVVGGLDTSDQLRDRVVDASTSCKVSAEKVSDPQQRTALAAQIRAAQTGLVAMPPLPGMSTTKPATMPTQEEVNAWMSSVGDPAARQRVRQTLYFAGNVYQLLVGLEVQKRTLTVKESEASVDSELSCVNLGNYDRTRWVVNAFHHSGVGAQLRDRMIRTARIDGPTPAIAQRLFDDAIAVEKTGLKGDLVLDARGLDAQRDIGSYGYFDQSIRNTAKLAAAAPDLPTIFDNNQPLLANGSSTHAAVYCGWYQLRKYQPTVKPLPGAIAYHVASLEMITLRSPIETGWCRGLLLDGADVTVGAVGEPYLAAFPPADDFLGLLFTGKVTLAEAYWASIPITSWKMILIGDPLYRPFAANPQVSLEKLPESLRAVAN